MTRQTDDTGGNGGTARGRHPSGKRKRAMTNSLVALSSAAVVAVYVVGYARTESAAASLTSATPTASVAAAAAPSARLIPTPPATAAPSAAATTVPSTTARAAATPTATTSAALRDGSYVGTGSSRHGSIEATVIVQAGKVVSAEITKCGTRYPCSRIASLPGQVVARQSPSVDVVSGATDSAVAYKAAVTAALAKAR